MSTTLPPPLPPPGSAPQPTGPAPTTGDRCLGQHHDAAVRRALDEDGTAVAVLDLDGTVGFVNHTMLELVGARSIADVSVETPAAALLRSFLDQLPSELFAGEFGVWRGQLDHRTMSGRQLVLQATAHLAPTANGRDVVLIARDVTDTETELAALQRRASRDALTGLISRQRLLHQLANAARSQRHRHGHLAVIVVDVDDFAQVNDLFGHGAGDEVLAACAQRLTAAARPGDCVARVGGDELAIVAEQLDDKYAAVELADRAGRALTGRIRVGDVDLELTVSVGVALSDDGVLTLDAHDAASRLLADAEAATADAHANGGARTSVFTSKMRADAAAHAELAAQLSASISAGALDVDYQPIYSLVTREVVGAEALVRWHHPTRGSVDAATTVRIAETAESIGRLGDLVLARALGDLVRWRRDGRVTAAFAVHVNVSLAQLASASLVDTVSAQLAAHDIAPHQLVLEAHESPLLSSRPCIVRSIRALRRLGVRVAIDDFGTGPKSLAVLTDVGVDMLKLDGSLSLPPGSTLADVRVVRAVIALAHSLDMDVVAEHVTALEQLERLRASGCDTVQGHLLAAPVADADLTLTPTPLW